MPVVAAFVVIAASVALQYPRWSATFTPDGVMFVDPDDYMRMYRAREVATGEAWRIRNIDSINAPHGAELHWTAPTDYLLAGAGRLLERPSGRPDAFDIAGACLPAALGAIYVACMLAFMRRPFGWTPALLAGGMVVLSPAFHRVFLLGHPDHHCVLELLFLLAIGPWLRYADSEDRSAATHFRAAGSGLAAGLAVWVAPQAMLIWIAIAAGLLARCRLVRRGESSDGEHIHSNVPRTRSSQSTKAGGGSPRSEPASRSHSAALTWAAVSTIVIVSGHAFENWPNLTQCAIDKVSAFHAAWAIIAVGLLSILALRGRASPASPAAAPSRSPLRRSVRRLFHVVLASWLALIVLSSAFLLTRWGEVSRYVRGPEFLRWSSEIAELQPLIVVADGAWSLRRLHETLGFLPYALPMLLVFFWTSKQLNRVAKVTFGFLATAITVLAIAQIRWIDHFNVAVAPVTAIGVCELSRRLLCRRGSSSPRAVGLLSGGLVAVLIAVPAWSIITRSGSEAVRGNALAVRTARASDVIRDHVAQSPAGDPNRRAILCEDGEGPMLLYRTGLPVVATPYHRALDGLLEAARFFAERDPAAARRQLDRLGVRYVVLPPRAHEQLMQFERMAFGELRSYDLPRRWIDESGRLREELRYRPELTRTMAYRLLMERGEVIPGVELLEPIREGAQTPDGLSGWIFLVNEQPDEPPNT